MKEFEFLLRNLQCYESDIEILKINVGEESADHFEAVIQCRLVGDSPKEGCKRWIADFSEATHTNWIVRRTCPSPKRHVYRVAYDCQHSNFQKQKDTKHYSSERNKDCKATVKMKTKKINRNTIKNDMLLKKGLNTIVTIDFNHSHNVEFSFLRVDKHTEALYTKYFEDGMTPSAARIYHETFLIQSQIDEKSISFILANSQKNPRERQVKYLYDKWRKRRATTEAGYQQSLSGGGPESPEEKDPLMEAVSIATNPCPWESTVYEASLAEQSTQDSIDFEIVKEELEDEPEYLFPPSASVDQDKNSAIDIVNITSTSNEPYVIQSTSTSDKNQRGAASFFEKEHNLKIEKLTDSILQQKELHSIRMKIEMEQLHTAIAARKKAESEAELALLKLNFFKKENHLH